MSKSCFWGKPCNCSDCLPPVKKLCEICCKEKGVCIGSTLRKDRKGCKYYNFTTCCEDCYYEEFGKKEEAYFNELFRLLHQREIKKESVPEPKFYTTKSEIEFNLCWEFKKAAECKVRRRLIFQMLGNVNTKICWKSKSGKEYEYESGEILALGDDPFQWFKQHILDKVIEKIGKNVPISITKMELFPTYKGIKVHHETDAEARRREWCRKNL